MEFAILLITTTILGPKNLLMNIQIYMLKSISCGSFLWLAIMSQSTDYGFPAPASLYFVYWSNENNSQWDKLPKNLKAKPNPASLPSRKSFTDPVTAVIITDIMPFSVSQTPTCAPGKLPASILRGRHLPGSHVSVSKRSKGDKSCDTTPSTCLFAQLLGFRVKEFSSQCVHYPWSAADRALVSLVISDGLAYARSLS